MRQAAAISLVLIWALGAAALPAQDGDIPDHPSKLTFPPLEYDPPQRAEYRHVLNHGVVAYLVPDRELPLVTVRVLIRAGDYLDPSGKAGLANAVGSLLRSGGTERWDAETFDEEADFLAADISSSLGDTSGAASVNALSKDLDRALELFGEMLVNPAFQEDRVELYRSQVLQALERRNDRTSSIEGREWARLLRGGDHFTTIPATKSTVEAITRDDLDEFHQRYYQPANFIVAVSGDFQVEPMKERLNALLGRWPDAGGSSAEIPEPGHTPVAGVYMVHKEDVNQGRVSIGHLGLERGHPDQFAVELMNDILGGSGFTSRITERVRSDEGLAYSAFSSFSFGVHFPGTFRAGFQSKSATCAEATQIVIDEIARIRSEMVSEDELETVRTGAIEIFPRFFSSAGAIARTFANDELTGREYDYWNTYRDRLKAVTREDVLRVAQEHLHPDRLVILAVGDVEAMLAGNPDKPQYQFEKLAPDGKIVRIPLPDPLTMVYPE